MQKLTLRVVDTNKLADDIDKSMRLVDELCAAALSLTTGGHMAYTSFIQTRDEFKQHINNVAKSYKIVELE